MKVSLLLVMLIIPSVSAIDTNTCIPEFSTITAGIALIGAMIGYTLLKNRQVIK